MKVEFNQEANNIDQDDCRMKIMACFSDLNLTFLNEGEGEKEEEEEEEGRAGDLAPTPTFIGEWLRSDPAPRDMLAPTAAEAAFPPKLAEAIRVPPLVLRPRSLMSRRRRRARLLRPGIWWSKLSESQRNSFR